MGAKSELISPPIRDYFASDFGKLFSQLLKYTDQISEEFLAAANQVRRFVVDFWQKQLSKQPQDVGSFGTDQNGVDQLALCMKINTLSEMSLCKWGLEDTDQGERLPKMDILTSIDHKGSPQWVFNIDIHGQQFQITRTDLRPKMKSAKEQIVVTF